MTNKIFSAFLAPKKGDLGSSGPGTGPTQRDSQISTPPGRVIPKPLAPNMLGYGGGPDAVHMLGRPVPEDIQKQVQHRMPGLAVYGPPGPIVPNFNKAYSTLRDHDSLWRYMSDDVVTVTLTPNAGATAQTAVSPTANGGNFKLRTSQYPGAIQVHLVVRTFAMAPQASTATGAIEFRLNTAFGDVIPLGVYVATQTAPITMLQAIGPTPIADAGIPNYGNLIAISQGLATPVAVTVQLGFSFLYLLPDPAFRGYAAQPKEVRA